MVRLRIPFAKGTAGRVVVLGLEAAVVNMAETDYNV